MSKTTNSMYVLLLIAIMKWFYIASAVAFGIQLYNNWFGA